MQSKILKHLLSRRARSSAQQTAKVVGMATQGKRGFAAGVYLWMPKLDGRLTGIAATASSVNRSLARGNPERVAAFDDLDAQKLRIGTRHTAILAADGMLYTFGYGNWGILGHGNEKDIRYDEPKMVAKFAQMGLKVVDVALGDYHTLALTEDGNVWTWGYAGKKGMFNWMYSQEVGALGHGDVEAQFTPKKVAYFEENGIKIKKISCGLYHCNALAEDNTLYNWGRGLYGVLGNGSNSPTLVPKLNDSMEAIRSEIEDFENNIEQMDSASEYTVVRMSDGSLNAWGKNDRGQMGTTPGIGIDMVESENVPTMIDLKDENGTPKSAKDFAVGQYTMLVQDEDNQLYQTGLRWHYEPKKLSFGEDVLDVNDVKLLACGKRNYTIVTNDNQLLIWGNVIKLEEDE